MRNKKNTRSTNSRFSAGAAEPTATSLDSTSLAAATQPPRYPTHDEIAARAHAIWIEQGCPEGREVENWLEAERQLGGPAPASRDVAADLDTTNLNERDSDGVMTNRVQDRLDDSAARERRASATSVNL